MKTIYYLFTTAFLFASQILSAQTANLVIFSQDADRFYVMINGVHQNKEAQSNVKITQMPSNAYKVKVVFQDNSLAPLEKTVYPEAGQEYSMNIKRSKKGVLKMNLFSVVEINNNTQPGQYVYVYGSDNGQNLNGGSTVVGSTTTNTNTVNTTNNTVTNANPDYNTNNTVVTNNNTINDNTTTTTTTTTTTNTNATTNTVNSNVAVTGTDPNTNGSVNAHVNTSITENPNGGTINTTVGDGQNSVNVNVSVTETGINMNINETGNPYGENNNVNMNTNINGTQPTNTTNSTYTETTTVTNTTTVNGQVVDHNSTTTQVNSQNGNTNVTTTNNNMNTNTNYNTNTNTNNTYANNNNTVATTAAPCYGAMTDMDFATLQTSIKEKKFEDSKLSVANQALKANCMNSNQVKAVMKLFTHESTRLDFAKSAYKRCSDPQNYFQVNDAFDFESSIDDLKEALGQ